MEKLKTFNNEKTLNHEFFNSERHFINYCHKVCNTTQTNHPKLIVKNLDYFAWSLAHESVFKRNMIKPPYAILIATLKKDNNIEELNSLFV
jgi:hypothetical protein